MEVAEELATEWVEWGVTQILIVVESLGISSSVRMPVDLESMLMLEGAMLSVSVSMLSSDWARERFVNTTPDRLWNIGRVVSKLLTLEPAVDTELLLDTLEWELGITTTSSFSPSSSVLKLSTRSLGCVLVDRLTREE